MQRGNIKQVKEALNDGVFNNEEFDFGYEAAALGMQRIASYPKAWLEGYDSFHAAETRSENARFV